jgi:peptide/nickel transport system substrate-binding protein
MTHHARRAHLTIALLALTGLASAGCAGSSSGGKKTSSSSLVIAIADEPSTLDPQKTEDGNERAVTDNIYDTLLRRDTSTSEIKPWLATALPKQLNDTTWQFTLKTGVKFSDDEPFDATAAAFSVNRVIDKKYNSAQVDFYSGIKHATAVNATTLNVETAAFDPVFVSRMVRLKMVPPKAAAKTSFTEQPVGTGPYVLVKWERGKDVILKANPNYWGDAPKIKNATIRFISQAGTRVAGLRTGEIQLATVIPPEQAGQAPQVITRDGLEFPVYRLKSYAGVLKDPRIRQAMNYAVDKNALAKNLFSGYASVAQCQTLTKAHTGFDPSLQAYPYDPNKAKQLLKDAGYNGQTVTLLGATGRWLKDAEMTESVVSFLEAVGMKVKVDVRPFSSYIGEFVKPVGQTQPDIGFVSASNDLFDASKIDSYYASKGALSSYVDSDVDAALSAAASEKDKAARDADYAKALQIGCQTDPVFIFTVNLKDIYGAAKSLKWKPRVDGALLIQEMQLT